MAHGLPLKPRSTHIWVVSAHAHVQLEPGQGQEKPHQAWVDFEIAKDVFLDRSGLVEIDDSDPDEERWRLIGLAGTKLLFVVFTEPDDDVIHIISARAASKSEERRYFGQAAP